MCCSYTLPFGPYDGTIIKHYNLTSKHNFTLCSDLSIYYILIDITNITFLIPPSLLTTTIIIIFTIFFFNYYYYYPPLTSQLPHTTATHHTPGTQPKPVIHSVRVVTETIGLCEQVEGGLRKGFQHGQQPSNTPGLTGILIHQDTTQVQEAAVAVGNIQAHDLDKRGNRRNN